MSGFTIEDLDRIVRDTLEGGPLPPREPAGVARARLDAEIAALRAWEDGRGPFPGAADAPGGLGRFLRGVLRALAGRVPETQVRYHRHVTDTLERVGTLLDEAARERARLEGRLAALEAERERGGGPA